MSFDFNSFDAREVTPEVATAYPVIPAGKYRMSLVSVTRKENYAKTGDCWECKFEVTKGEHVGKRVTRWLDLFSSNMSDQQKAAGELSAICNAVRVYKPKQDGSNLLHIDMICDVGCFAKKKKPGEYGNDIKSYQSLENAMDEAKKAAKQTATAGVQSDDSAPWE